jgi:hypothetical protein
MSHRKGGDPGVMGNKWFHNKRAEARRKRKLAKQAKRKQR